MAALCVCIGAVGGWITARVASQRPFRHVVMMVVVMLVIGLLKPILVRNAEPLASHLAFLAGLATGTLLGGRIGSTQPKKRDVVA